MPNTKNQSNNKSQWVELLKSKKLKATVPRMAIIKALLMTNKPIKIDQLSGLLEKNNKFPASTFYRSLKKLTDSGIVYKAYFNEVAAYYELQRDHHHHLTCVYCGRQVTLPCNKSINGQFSSKSVPSEFKLINYHVLEYFGVCKKCH